MGKKLTKAESDRLKFRPYYAALYAINKLKARLPTDVEECLASDPEACLLYAERVMGGPLPDFLHNAMVLGCWEGVQRDSVDEYLRTYFPEGSRTAG